LNAGGFALEIAWLRLLADAGCLTEDQVAQATTVVAQYTAALQTALQTAGLYDGPIDGIYGPSTVAAVEQLQTDNDLPVTGFVDEATAVALSAAVLAVDSAAATAAVAQTAAVQSVLKLAGYWAGDIDGEWTPELTEALKAFQTELGVEPTGAVDVATLHALQTAVAEAQAGANDTTTTTSPPETTAAETTVATTAAAVTTAAAP
jgi:peptidoglycan hydrolase-like protein with peptidoglycan-binding domain